MATPTPTATPADLRAKKARLDVTYDDIERALRGIGFPYTVDRIRKVMKERETSAPLCDAVWRALDVLEDELDLAPADPTT